MIKPEIALKYAKGLRNYCQNFKDCNRYCGCIFYKGGGCCPLAADNSPDTWELEDINIEDNRSTDPS